MLKISRKRMNAIQNILTAKYKISFLVPEDSKPKPKTNDSTASKKINPKSKPSATFTRDVLPDCSTRKDEPSEYSQDHNRSLE